MSNINLLSRNSILATLFVLGCGIIGVISGRYTISTLMVGTASDNTPQQPKSEIAFVLPSGPPEKELNEEIAIDPDALRIWEITVKQPLPPRKEPLTAPSWKIVGVTEVGNEKNVLLLFEKQQTAEIRKIGDKLPGGAKIVQISQDHLQISLNGQLMILNLRKQ